MHKSGQTWCLIKRLPHIKIQKNYHICVHWSYVLCNGSYARSGLINSEKTVGRSVIVYWRPWNVGVWKLSDDIFPFYRVLTCNFPEHMILESLGCRLNFCSQVNQLKCVHIELGAMYFHLVLEIYNFKLDQQVNNWHFMTFFLPDLWYMVFIPIVYNRFQVKKKQFFVNFSQIMLFGAVGTLISCAIISLGESPERLFTVVLIML